MRIEHLVRGLGITVSTVLIGWTAFLCWPMPRWSPPSVASGGATTRPAATAAKPGINDYAVIWQRDLRQPVVDIPVPTPAVVAEPPPAIRLLGTAVAEDQQLGIFTLSNNTIVVKGVGETLDGYELLSVGRGEARLKHGDRSLDLRVAWFDQIASRGTD